MATTRTLGPIHLEDLDPHRFEDLVRQLLYDFRPWQSLEATGRSGSDGGFDARGIEGGATPDIETNDPAEGEPEPAYETPGRIWMIQAKREKAISPKKLQGYLDGIPAEALQGIYGIIFVAACDFSMKARNDFRARVRELGFAEAHLWGRAEVEDQLYQPKNDHLLFAYFGVSLQTRQRSLKTAVRARLVMKRKVLRHMDGMNLYRPVLLRDATDERYPFPDKTPEDKFKRFRWRVLRPDGCKHDGLHICVRRSMAFLDDDGVGWDFAEKMDDAPVGGWENPWSEKNPNEIDPDREEASAIWNAFPEGNRAWFESFGVLPYENIIDVDDKGDDWFDQLHIYTTAWSETHGPFSGYFEHLQTIGGTAGNLERRRGRPKRATRVSIFPRSGPKNAS